MARLIGTRTLASEFPEGEKVLSVFAAHAVGEPVRVVFNGRVTHPITVQAATGTVILDPTRTSVRDLLVAAALIRERIRIRSLCEGGHEDAVAAGIAAAWVGVATSEIHRRLPRLEAALRGWSHWLRPADRSRLPHIVWKTVPLEPLASGGLDVGGARVAGLPGLAFSGHEGDWGALSALIKAGRVPSREIAGFPMPVVTIPYELGCPAADGVELERFDQMRRGFMDVQDAWIRCYQLRSEDDAWNPRDAHRYARGKHLDTSRLATALAHARDGRPAAVFQRWRSLGDHVFDPTDHVLSIGFDANPYSRSSDLHPDAYRASLGRSHWIHDRIAILLNMVRRMSVAATVTAFLDRIVDVDGRQVYLHLPVRIKEARESWEGACTARLATILVKGLDSLPGTPAMLLPATLATLGQRLGDAVAGLPAGHLGIFGFFAGGLPATMPALRSDAMNSRVAEAAERIVARWHREWSACRFSCDHTHIPIEIKRAAAAGSKLRELVSLE